MTGWYVYGVVAASELDAGELHVELVEHDGVTAITRRVSLDDFGEGVIEERLRDPAWLEAKVMGHQAVLADVLARTGVVPLRFGAVFESDEHVRRMLQARPELREVLSRVQGAVELGVKAAPAARPATGEQPSSGADYLRANQRARRGEEERREAALREAEAVHERLAAAALDARSNPPQRGTQLVLNGAYLVRREQEASFRGLVTELAAEPASVLTFEVTGPWPAYNFVEPAAE